MSEMQPESMRIILLIWADRPGFCSLIASPPTLNEMDRRIPKHMQTAKAQRMFKGTKVSPRYFKKGDIVMAGMFITIVSKASRVVDGDQSVILEFVGGPKFEHLSIKGLRLYDPKRRKRG